MLLRYLPKSDKHNGEAFFNIQNIKIELFYRKM